MIGHINPCQLAPVNGCTPVIISYKTTHSAHISVRKSTYSSPRENLNDGRVTDGRRRTRLGEQTLGQSVDPPLDLRADQLQCHLHAQGEVLCNPDGPHAALAQDADQPVLLRDHAALGVARRPRSGQIDDRGGLEIRRGRITPG
jgi:hypothetical protein